MRILIHGINYTPELIGIGKYTGEMAEWLGARGHDVRVITAPPYYPYWKVQPPYQAWRFYKEVINGVTVFRCPLWVPKKPSGLKRIIHLLSWSASSSLALLRMIFWRPHVVFTVEPTIFGAGPALLAARIGGAQSWLHVQDIEVDAALGLGMVSKGKSLQLIEAYERWLMKRFDCVSSISIAMAQRLDKKCGEQDKIILFPNWVDCKAFQPLPVSLRGEWGVDKSTNVILYAGNIGKKQGLDVILNIADKFKSIYPNVLFLFVGDGASRADLEKSAKENNLTNVKFKPIQPIEKLPALLAMADVHLVMQQRGAADLVMPSKLSGIMAAGGAALVTAEKGTELHHIVESNRLGLVVEPESEEAILSGLTKLLEQNELRVEYRKNAILFAERELDKEVILRRFEAGLLRLIA